VETGKREYEGVGRADVNGRMENGSIEDGDRSMDHVDSVWYGVWRTYSVSSRVWRT